MNTEYKWQEQQPYAYWLQSTEGIGNKSLWQLTEYAGSPKAIYEMTQKEWGMVLPKKKVQDLVQRRREIQPDDLYKDFCGREIQYIPNCHPAYPKRLRQISDAPYGIFVLGNLPTDEKPTVAVIGARQCSEYGRYVANQCATQLARAGVAVLSGMARGIDGIAHGAALRAGGDTYAVLGCGVDVCYPSENRTLYEAIKKKGGVLSEYVPGTQPKAGLFPVRNRIISGLADVVLIVEAREKSGTLITADLALEQGKEVYVIPGRVTDPLSQGCNRLIRQGAGMMLSVEEMLEETGLMDMKRQLKGKDRKIEEVTEEKGKVAENLEIDKYLDYYPKSIEELQRESGMEYRQILLEITKLCMKQQAVQISPNQYVKTKK